MRRILKTVSAAAAAAMLLVSVAACAGGGQNPAGGEAEGAGSDRLTIHFIPKNLGNPYFEALSSGFYDAISELGEDNFEYVYTGPDVADAANQIPFVEEAVRRGADAIFIAANSNDALNDAFDAAREAGVRVYIINQDIPGSEDHRDAAIMPVDFETVGAAQIGLLAEQMGYKGRFAILSATVDAPDQNMWVELMKDELSNNPAYADMELLEVFYGDDQFDKSASETEAIIGKYPDIDGIIAPTAVGIGAVCKVVQDSGMAGRIKVTGLGLPSEMAGFVKNGVCDGFQLWNPPYEGYLAVYMVWAESKGNFTPAPGASFSAGKLGERTVLPNGQILTLETPMLYDGSNIDEYSILF
ncbi:MAG: substrate-binding domain-containing protein [Clostridiales Family XIII bacterium]|jgi:rhamnose transport system substrate-binding protein|nr:substrate-binding domain-containing protein [Clostridiales Family XIII bacterium]